MDSEDNTSGYDVSRAVRDTGTCVIELKLEPRSFVGVAIEHLLWLRSADDSGLSNPRTFMDSMQDNP